MGIQVEPLPPHLRGVPLSLHKYEPLPGMAQQRLVLVQAVRNAAQVRRQRLDLDPHGLQHALVGDLTGRAVAAAWR